MKTHTFDFTFSQSSAPIVDVAFMVCDIISDITFPEEYFVCFKDKNLINVDEIEKTIINENTKIVLYIKTDNLIFSQCENPLESFRYSLLDLKEYFGINIEYTVKNEKLLGIDQKSDESTCVVCLDNEPQIAYETCKHLVICYSCYSNLKDTEKCVYCRTVNINIALKKNILNIKDYYIP